MAGSKCTMAVVVMLNVLIMLPSAQASIVGDTCSSRGPEYLQACVNDWVKQQQANAAAAGIVGASCTTVSPSYQQACINTWIQEHLAASGTVGGCGGVSADNQQACLNALVMQKQQDLSSNQQQPIMGSTCATVSPSSFQACLNSYVFYLQTLGNSDAAPGALVAICSESDQPCINSFITTMQQQEGVLGGCAGVAPAFKQACINNYVLSLQQQSSMGAPAPGVFSMSATATSSKVTTSTSDVHVTTVGDNEPASCKPSTNVCRA